MPLVSKTPKEPKPLNFRDRYGVARIHCYAMFDTLNSVATETQQDPSLLRLRVAGSSRNNLVKAARRISKGNKIYNKLKANELLDDHWGGLTPTRFQKYFTSKPAPLAAKAKKKPAKNAKRQPRFIPEVAPFDVYRSLVMHYFPIMSPVTSKPASRGRIKTSHSEARDSYHFCFLDQGISATS